MTVTAWKEIIWNLMIINVSSACLSVVDSTLPTISSLIGQIHYWVELFLCFFLGRLDLVRTGHPSVVGTGQCLLSSCHIPLGWLDETWTRCWTSSSSISSLYPCALNLPLIMTQMMLLRTRHQSSVRTGQCLLSSCHLHLGSWDEIWTRCWSSSPSIHPSILERISILSSWHRCCCSEQVISQRSGLVNVQLSYSSWFIGWELSKMLSSL